MTDRLAPEVGVASISVAETSRLRNVESRYRALRVSLTDASRWTTAASAPSEAERVTLREKIRFAHDRAGLSATAKAVLRKKVRVFSAHPCMQITITGYASEPGSKSYNRSLGLRRAEAARDYLVARGVDGTRIRTGQS